MALDRAHLDRGHAKLSGDRPTSWDLPVAIGAWWPPPRLELHQPLSNGSLVVHVPVHDDPKEEMTRLPLDSLNWSMVKIHKDVYNRYNRLALQWDHIQGETAPLVLCQTRLLGTSSTNVKSRRITGDATRRPQELQLSDETNESMPR